MAKNKYASLYTLRSDGRYQGYYRDAAGKRHALCDADPEQLHRKLMEKQAAASAPARVLTFRAVAESWENRHREEIEARSWKNIKPHYGICLTASALCRLRTWKLPILPPILPGRRHGA